MKIRVECYSGYKANERPLRFHVGDKVLEVRELLGRWVGEDADFFKVAADDGNDYILEYNRRGDSWEVTTSSNTASTTRPKGERR